MSACVWDYKNSKKNENWKKSLFSLALNEQQQMLAEK